MIPAQGPLAGKKPFPARFSLPIGILPFAAVTGLALVWLSANAWNPVFDLPREGHQAIPVVEAVGEWRQGDQAFLGLTMLVKGEDLPENQLLRFTEGCERVHATARIRWLDAEAKAIGKEVEISFKDDCCKGFADPYGASAQVAVPQRAIRAQVEVRTTMDRWADSFAPASLCIDIAEAQNSPPASGSRASMGKGGV